jgi:hypothetical protein
MICRASVAKRPGNTHLDFSIACSKGERMNKFRLAAILAVDSQGNIYTGEAGFGWRVQKFNRVD